MPRRIDTAFVEFVPDVSAIVDADRDIRRFFDGTAKLAEQSAESVEESFTEAQRELEEIFDELVKTGTVDLERITDVAERTAMEMSNDFERATERAEESYEDLRRTANNELDRIDKHVSTTAVATSRGFGAAGIAASAAFLGIGAAATAGLGAIAFMGLSSAAQLEQVQISFNALLGSAEAGEKMFRQLQKFAALTPFEFPEVAAAAKRFFAFNQQVGLADDQIEDILTTVGDLASVTGAGAEGLNRIFLALSQIAGKGKVSLEELRQIGEAVPGFSAVDAIASQLGVTTGEAMDMISEGAIDATTGINALLLGMQAFPGAAGAMEKQSQTLLGVWSTFKDTVGQALADAFTPVIPAIKQSLSDLTPILGEALEAFVPALGSLLANTLPILGSLTKALAPLVGTFLELINVILIPLTPILEEVANVLGAELGKVLVALTPVLMALLEPLGEVLIALLPLIPALADLLVALLPLLIPLIDITAGLIAMLAIKGIVPLVELLAEGIALIIPHIEAFAGWLEAINWGEVGEDIAGGFMTAWTAVKNFFIGIGRFFRDLPRNVLNFIKSLPQRFVELLQRMFVTALQVIGIGIGLLIVSFLKTPELLVGALKALPGLLMSFLNFVWDGVVKSAKTTWNNVITFFTKVPGMIVNALTALPGVVASIFTTLKNRAVEIVGSLISTIVGFFLGLPSRLSGFAANVGGGIVDFIKRALNNAIAAINSGIDMVDQFIPGNLPRLPFLAKGGVFTGPAVVGEAGTEAAIPLTDARAMSALVDAFTRASGDGPGAMTNNFTVVVEIDGQQFDARVVRVIDEGNRKTKRRVMARNAR